MLSIRLRIVRSLKMRLRMPFCFGVLMQKIKYMIKYFSKWEWCLFSSSILLITVSFCLFDRSNYLNFIASLIGATSLIFCAKGNPIGQVLMIIFSVLYGMISYKISYYGEMLTYVGLTLPMAAFSLVSWMKNPYGKGKSEVKVAKLKRGEWLAILILTACVTVAFYFILKRFGTANLLPSTLSVATSFLAAYLTFRRNPFYALAYAANDVVLIVLWILAGVTDLSYLSVMTCFVVFLFNDVYGFISWRRMQKRQSR